MKRVVTGKTADGRDTIVEQGTMHPIAAMRGSGNEARLCWATSNRITLPHDGADPVAGAEMTMPAPGESRFVFVTFPPGSVTPMHATPTIDCVAVVAGELWLVMESGSECRLEVGDSIIQTGTRHAWANRSSQPCTIAAVMMGAERS
jgi:quercetin dioxygenase-like cupin family protein